MRLSQFPVTTLKEVPADAEVISHQLMLRAGLIRRLASGLYSWLPLGTRVLRRVELIVREEMNRAGGLELLMPAVQPSELWEESGRWNKFGPELLRFEDRHKRAFCLGPTHEEVITDIARRELNSYRQLPVNYYQIQAKFRDEIRPRFGVMRSREFIMKDAYSFHIDEASLEAGYQRMRDAYTRIFERMGLKFRIVQADSGAIGGSRSEEFHVLADSGEDAIAYNDSDHYAANVEMVPTQPVDGSQPGPAAALAEVATPAVRTIAELGAFLKVAAEQCIKTLVVAGTEQPAVALLIRGDHELNALKAAALPEVAAPLRMLRAGEVETATGAPPGCVGPVGLNIPIVADHAVLAMGDFVCGSNHVDTHLTGANFERDLPRPRGADLRNAVPGDPSPSGGGPLSIARGIEVGHIFQLGTQYSERMAATVLDKAGTQQALAMGCYGIGITRVVAAAIEQNHDDRGIVWPDSISPFDVVLIPIRMNKSERVKTAIEELYGEMQQQGLAVLLDDRDQRPGSMFADADLLGIPHRVVVSERGLDAGTLEYKGRRDADNQNITTDELFARLKPS
jgi:prolyl-tRNA synthetase